MAGVFEVNRQMIRPGALSLILVSVIILTRSFLTVDFESSEEVNNINRRNLLAQVGATEGGFDDQVRK